MRPLAPFPTITHFSLHRWGAEVVPVAAPEIGDGEPVFLGAGLFHAKARQGGPHESRGGPGQAQNQALDEPGSIGVPRAGGVLYLSGLGRGDHLPPLGADKLRALFSLGNDEGLHQLF